MRLADIAFCAAMLGGCGGGGGKAAPASPQNKPEVAAMPAPSTDLPPTADDSELQKRGLVLLSQFGGLVSGHTDDCPSLGKKLNAFVATNKPLITELDAAEKKESPEQKKAFEDRHRDDMEKFLSKIGPNLKKCANDPDVQKAFKDLEE